MSLVVINSYNGLTGSNGYPYTYRLSPESVLTTGTPICALKGLRCYVRIANCLQHLGINFLEELDGLKWKDLSNVKNFGHKSYMALVVYMEENHPEIQFGDVAFFTNDEEKLKDLIVKYEKNLNGAKLRLSRLLNKKRGNDEEASQKIQDDHRDE